MVVNTPVSSIASASVWARPPWETGSSSMYSSEKAYELVVVMSFVYLNTRTLIVCTQGCRLSLQWKVHSTHEKHTSLDFMHNYWTRKPLCIIFNLYIKIYSRLLGIVCYVEVNVFQSQQVGSRAKLKILLHCLLLICCPPLLWVKRNVFILNIDLATHSMSITICLTTSMKSTDSIFFLSGLF